MSTTRIGLVSALWLAPADRLPRFSSLARLRVRRDDGLGRSLSPVELRRFREDVDIVDHELWDEAE